MTTITIDENISFSTTHFRSVKELYEKLRLQYEFEESLEKSAEKVMNTSYSELVNI
ncbi:MAG: hypothetical protein PHN60_04320 [Candidatus Gracilibacteria bacterium]|nr:hypothetical protein [Candidatus Gracilibacteria bacterium]